MVAHQVGDGWAFALSMRPWTESMPVSELTTSTSGAVATRPMALKSFTVSNASDL